jgi:hypothetical protein
MKEIITILLLFLTILLFFSNPAHAQSFAIPWWTVDGGGGTSTGGGYTLSGTIGQPDAGMMTGGGYSLIGGFWSFEAQHYLFLPLILKN